MGPADHIKFGWPVGWAMGNPWLDVPLEDYEGHMTSAAVRQLDDLSGLFAEALTRCQPGSVAVPGIAGGNGLEHIDGRVTRRVIGIDINPSYLDAVRQRYSGIEGLELICADLSEGAIACDPVQLVHAALVFEHAGVGRCLDNTLALVAPGGSLSVVLQLPGDIEPAVGSGSFASIRNLSAHFATIDPPWLRETIEARGFRMEYDTRRSLVSRKGFWMGVFVRAC